MKNFPWKKVFKWLLITLFTIGVTFLALFYYLWSSLQEEAFQKRVARAVEERLPYPFNHKVRIGRIGGRFPGSILISHLEMELPSGDKVALKELTLNWDWRELFNRRFVLKRLRVDSLHISLRQGAKGGWLPDLQSESQPSPPPENLVVDSESPTLPQLMILLEEIAIEDMRFTATSGNASWQNVNFSLPQLTLKGELDLGPDRLLGNLDLNQNLSFKLDQHPKLDLTLEARLSFTENDWSFNVSPLSLQTPRSRVMMELSTMDPIPFPHRMKNFEGWLEQGTLNLELQTLRLDNKEVRPLLDHELALQDILAQGNLAYTPGRFSSNVHLQTGRNSLSLVSKALVDPLAMDLKDHDTRLNWKVSLNNWAKEFHGELSGRAHLNGSLESMGTELSIDLTELVVPESSPPERVQGDNVSTPILEEMKLTLSTNLALKALINRALPSLPTFSGNSGSLAQEWKKMNGWFDEHRQELPSPELKISVKGFKGAPPLNDLLLNVMTSPEGLGMGIKGHGPSGNQLIGMELLILATEQDVTLSLKEVSINPEMGLHREEPAWAFLLSLPIFNQAVRLEKPNLLVLNRKEGRLVLKDFGLVAQKPFIKIDGEIFILDRMLDLRLDILEQSSSIWIPTELDLPLIEPGVVSGLLSVNGHLPWPKAHFDLKLRGAEVGTPGSNLSLAIEQGGVQADFDPILREMSLELGLTTSEGLPLKAKGKLPLDLSETAPKPAGDLIYTVDVGATEALDISRFSVLLPKNLSDLKGAFSLELNGKMNPSDPTALNLNGRLGLKGGSISIDSPSLTFNAIELTMMVHPEGLVVKKLSARQGEGLLNLTGKVHPSESMNWLQPHWEFDLGMVNWPVVHPPLLKKGILESQLKVSGNMTEHRISGLVKARDLMVYPAESPISPSSQTGMDPNIVFQDEVVSWEDFDRIESKKDAPPPEFLETLDLDLIVQLEQNNWIRHDKFRGELAGKLSVQSRLGSRHIHPKGTLFLQRAELDFQGNKFHMDEGKVTFVGDFLPAIDMTFSTEIKSWVIDVILQAPVPTELTPELRSSPWLSNSDIISVLLFGKPIHAASEEGSGGSMAQDFAAAQGAALVGQKLGLANKGIDLEDVSSTGGRVRIGRYLHPKVYVSAAKSVGEEDGHQLSIEYIIRRGFKVRTIREDEEPLGFEVEWGKDY